MSKSNNTPALDIDTTHQSLMVKISGDWTLEHYSNLLNRINTIPSNTLLQASFDLSQLNKLDTAGALLLVKVLGEKRVQQDDTLITKLDQKKQSLIRLVYQTGQTHLNVKKPLAVPQSKITLLLAHLGKTVVELYQLAVTFYGFLGWLLVVFLQIIIKPKRWRLTSLTANIEQIGFRAVPIVSLLTFMVGAVVAFLGATVLAKFGATIYTVNLVVFAFLREFAVLLTAILLAGRTASAFTAQIGAMKANEEIDALLVQGLSPMELLVIPRVMALLVSLPVLTFIGMLCGILGGMTVCLFALEISSTVFFNIVKTSSLLSHFLIGLCKAPVFAILIATIGCLEGFKVTGSAESVGQHTTSSVVYSIFIVIVVDAIAALFFMQLGW